MCLCSTRDSKLAVWKADNLTVRKFIGLSEEQSVSDQEEYCSAGGAQWILWLLKRKEEVTNPG
jgi:hypothetical protein